MCIQKLIVVERSSCSFVQSKVKQSELDTLKVMLQWWRYHCNYTRGCRFLGWSEDVDGDLPSGFPRTHLGLIDSKCLLVKRARLHNKLVIATQDTQPYDTVEVRCSKSSFKRRYGALYQSCPLRGGHTSSVAIEPRVRCDTQKSEIPLRDKILVQIPD